MSPFSPQGDRSMRVTVTDLAVSAAVDEILSFEVIAHALNIPLADRSRVRQAVSASRNSLLRDYNRLLVAERGKGYRVARPGEFAGQAELHRERSDRQISKALALVDNAPTYTMSPDELRRHRDVSNVLHGLASRMAAAEKRQADFEAATQQRQTTLEDRLADLEKVVYPDIRDTKLGEDGVYHPV